MRNAGSTINAKIVDVINLPIIVQANGGHNGLDGEVSGNISIIVHAVNNTGRKRSLVACSIVSIND